MLLRQIPLLQRHLRQLRVLQQQRQAIILQRIPLQSREHRIPFRPRPGCRPRTAINRPPRGRRPSQTGPQSLRTDGQIIRQPLIVIILLYRLPYRNNEWTQPLRHPRLPLRRANVHQPPQRRQQIIKQWYTPLHHILPSRRILPDDFIRILPPAQNRHPQLQILRPLRWRAVPRPPLLPLLKYLPRRLQTPQRRLLPRRVGVQRHRYPMRQPPRLRHLRRRQRRPHRRHHIPIAMLMGHNSVHIPLDNDQPFPPRPLLGQIQPVQRPPLVKNRRPPRIQILRRSLRSQRPTPEPSQLPRPVANRNHQPPPKSVPIPPAPVFLHNPRIQQLLRAEPLLCQIPQQRLPLRRTQPQLELLNAASRNPPSRQILPRRRPPLSRQPLLKKTPGRLVNAVSHIQLLPPLPRRQRHPRLLRQPPQNLPKLQILRLHHKGENIPPGSARPKAPPTLPVRIHIKRRRPFLMKRAIGLIIPPGMLQSHIPGNHFHQIQATLNIVNNRHPLSGHASPKNGRKRANLPHYTTPTPQKQTPIPPIFPLSFQLLLPIPFRAQPPHVIPSVAKESRRRPRNHPQDNQPSPNSKSFEGARGNFYKSSPAVTPYPLTNPTLIPYPCTLTATL